MAEADPTQEKLKKYEKAVKKLKAANEKATKELAEQKNTFESALAEKSSLVESLKAAAAGGKDKGGGEDPQYALGTAVVHKCLQQSGPELRRCHGQSDQCH